MFQTENRALSTTVADQPHSSSSASHVHFPTSPSPEYEPVIGEDEFAKTKENDPVTPMDVDPVKVEQDPPQLLALVTKYKVCPYLPYISLPLILSAIPKG